MGGFSRRRLVLAAGASLGAALPSLTQPQGKVAKIGFLFAGTIADRPQSRGLWDALQELGYTQGKNLLIEAREGKGRIDQLPQFARELVNWKPDVIVAVTPVAITAAQKATSSIPIVMAITGDPVHMGYVRSLARPDGNITGPVVTFNAALTSKRFQLLKDLIPPLSRAGYLWNTNNKLSSPQDLMPAAASLGVDLRSLPFQGPANLADASNLALSEKVQAILVQGDPVTFDRRTAIISFAQANTLPTAHTWRDEVTEGGLMAYGLSLYHEYRRVAPYVDKLLRGGRPGDLPIEQQRRWEFFINMKTAKALGIKVPQSVRVAADELIE